MSVLARNSFLGQNHMRVPCFCPVFMYTANVGCTRAKSGNRYTFFPESPFYTLLPGATFFGQNHMRVPCFRPVFMYTANVGCTRAKSGYRYTFLPGATFFGQNHMRVPCFRPVFIYTANVGLPIHVFAGKSVSHVVARHLLLVD